MKFVLHNSLNFFTPIMYKYVHIVCVSFNKFDGFSENLLLKKYNEEKKLIIKNINSKLQKKKKLKYIPITFYMYNISINMYIYSF